MLVAQNIGKRFGGVIALNDVTIQLSPARVTAIIGENGAGKSTLMKILSGVYAEFEGRILLNGRELTFSNPKEAQEKGISIIHQELNLIADLSITENIFLGRELSTRWGILDKKAMRIRTAALLQRLQLNVDPATLIRDLRVGQQQVVEIAKALLVDSQVIIMDEPTSAISEAEVDILFGIIQQLRTEGKIIAYISHKLDELFRIADDYVVLRDGCITETGKMQDVDADGIVRKMVGRDVTRLDQDRPRTAGTELLAVNSLRLYSGNRHILKDISFSLDRGEILGIFGLMGAGRTELLECILGLHTGSSTGNILLEGKPVRIRSPREAIRSGLVLVPEDRKKDGMIAGLDIKTNISLSSLPAGLINRNKEIALARHYMGSLRIKAASHAQPVKNLSGGNQQKVILARCLATNPKVLMLDEPTRGIDVNAKNEIYKLILEAAARGLGILAVSSELPEILAISDRILVLCEGRITGKFTRGAANEDDILKTAIPKTI
ncbi:MAG: sugar ABC transporter ATP-binding protein [Bacteroidetes bacterium]|nr:sugar ABC transporter ATP-binding protein [Bacteroidota bacterium]